MWLGQELINISVKNCLNFGSILKVETIGFGDDMTCKGFFKKMVIGFLALVMELIVIPFAQVEKGVETENHDVTDTLNLKPLLSILVEIH